MKLIVLLALFIVTWKEAVVRGDKTCSVSFEERHQVFEKAEDAKDFISVEGFDLKKNTRFDFHLYKMEELIKDGPPYGTPAAGEGER